MWKKMYIELLNGITKAIEMLQAASLEAERIYTETDDTPITLGSDANNPQEGG